MTKTCPQYTRKTLQKKNKNKNKKQLLQLLQFVNKETQSLLLTFDRFLILF